MQRNSESEIIQTMQDADIQAVSIASGNSKENVASIPYGEKQERFGVASLSKPVFVYLVLKLINAGFLNLDTNLNAAKYENQHKNIWTFAEFCQKEGVNWIDSEENRQRANQFTPHLILSHQTGLPINTPDPFILDFEPAQGYAYSRWGLKYMQQWIEEKTGRKLEDLAQEYVFRPAGMTHSSFNNPVANAANSLFTTTEDYARFCLHWMNDTDPLAQAAFESKVSLTNDPWAIRDKVSRDTLEHLSWGYGWGLEVDDSGRRFAFHTGDMCEWRSGVRLDLENKSVTVLFTKSKSENGHVLQEQVFGRSHALDFFFDKFKFARNPAELEVDWKTKASYGIRKCTIFSTAMIASNLGVTAGGLASAMMCDPEPDKDRVTVQKTGSDGFDHQERESDINRDVIKPK